MPTYPFVTQSLCRLAPQAGVLIEVEPEFGYVGQISTPNGKIHYFKSHTFDLNLAAAAAIALDKGYTAYFLHKMGFTVASGKTFYSADLQRRTGSNQDSAAACTYAENIGWPVIVKPNAGSMGNGVTIAHTKEQFYRAAKRIFQLQDVLLVQPVIAGTDYRLLLLDGQLMAAYRREPLSVVGNERETLQELFNIKQGKINTKQQKQSYIRATEVIQHAGLSWDFKPSTGQKVTLLANANLSSGGSAQDVTDSIHPYFIDIAQRASTSLGLRICGLDMLIQGDGTQSNQPYCVLEANAYPGVEHFARLGAKEAERVDNYFLQILRLYKDL